MFSPCFPLACLLSLLTNIIDTRHGLDKMAFFSRRAESVGVRDIGEWMSIMEFLSIICIPVNIALLLYVENEESASSSNFQAELKAIDE
mmetsp:Transcript_57192/g.78574  ORF Transcript_57192/g.78574 Transcript_57192/m.78574 type:complete len:89 (-) Transcript_57192:1112-1378(-)